MDDVPLSSPDGDWLCGVKHAALSCKGYIRKKEKAEITEIMGIRQRRVYSDKKSLFIYRC